MGLVFVNIILGCHPFRNTKQDIARFYNQLKQNGGADAFCQKIKNEEFRFICAKMLRFRSDERMTAEELC